MGLKVVFNPFSGKFDMVQDISGKEDVSNKSTNTSLGTSDTLYPTQKAVKTYVDNADTNLQNQINSLLAQIKLTSYYNFR